MIAVERIRFAAVLVLSAAVIAGAAYFLAAFGTNPVGFGVMFKPEVLRSVFLPALIPVCVVTVGILASDRLWSWKMALWMGAVAWLVYFAVQTVRQLAISDPLAQSYAAIAYVPWLLSWILVPVSYAIADWQHPPR